MSDLYDVAIVGGGPGGGLVFHECRRRGLNVVLFEKGGRIPLDESRAYSSSEMLEKYKSCGQTIMLGSPLIQYVEGSVLGGGSEINSGIYHRIPPKILEEWKEDFGLEFDRDVLDSACSDNEKLLHVARDSCVSTTSERLRSRAEARGFDVVQAPRWFKDGTRQSMSQTVFRTASESIRTRTEVRRIKETSGSVDVHHVRTGSGIKGVTRAKYVWICGGSIDTPMLLKRSGFRNANISRNLMCHPTVKLLVQFRDEGHERGPPVGVHQVKLDDDASFGCSIGTPSYLMLHMLDKSRQTKEKVASGLNRCAVYYCMIRPRSTGRVRSLLGAPLVAYWLSEDDKLRLLDGLLGLGDLFDTDDVELLVPSVSGIDDLESLRNQPASTVINKLNVMTIHLFGSCRMSSSEMTGVVDEDCRVFGSQRVYIGDSSIIPSAPGVNPQGPLMALVRVALRGFTAS